MKLNKMSVKWKLFGFIALFAVVMILILWLFQIVFLEDFYKKIKIDEIIESGHILDEHIEDDNIYHIITELSENNDLCVYILDVYGNPLYSSDVLDNCYIHNMSFKDYSRLYNKAMASNSKKYIERYQLEAYRFKDYLNIRPPTRITMEGMIYANVKQLDNGKEVLILLNSIISPVEATINTLRVQLVYITIVFMALALIIAVIISKVISKPIIKINDTAKQLAKGNYNVVFNGKGYNEISELNDTLNYAAKELSKVEGLRRELIANVSHDLRTPLTMISGYAEVIRDIPGENTPENVQVIIDESKRLTSLVNDLLDISKFESGIQVLNKEMFNLTLSINNIINRYSKLLEHESYNIKFEYDKEVYVVADKRRIEQVVYNLINNAITYTGEDKKVLIRQVINGGRVRVEVIDTGEGISKESLENIWDRYYKIDKTHRRAQVGTGLGLSIVKKILDMHNERYGVSSKEGVGSNFWFELNISQIK